ncbi:MAG: hypothetical protein QW728_02060 [Thermoplasmata archaeon]
MSIALLNKLDIVAKATLEETSNYTPSIAYGNDKFLLAWTGADGRLNVMLSGDALQWREKRTLNEKSTYGPSITFFNGKFVMAWVEIEKKLLGQNIEKIHIMQSVDGNTWMNKVTIKNEKGEEDVDVRDTPGITTCGNRLYLAWRNKKNNLNMMMSLNGVEWVNKRTLTEISESGPDLIGFNDNIVMAWRIMGSNKIGLMIGDTSKTLQKTTTVEEVTGAKPAIFVHDGKICIAWEELGTSTICIIKSNDGNVWYDKFATAEACFNGVDVTSSGESMVLAWAGTDKQHHLNTLLCNFRPE